VNRSKATYKKWVSETLDEPLIRQIEKLRNTKDVKHVRIMPDVHLANDVCIGCVIATEKLIYPAATGGDIGCGMLAQRFDGPATLINEDKAYEILQTLKRKVPILKHSREPDDWREETRLSCEHLNHLANRDGKYQLGTLGRGNHFLEFQEDEMTGCLWVMVHTGSRAMGPAIRKHHESASNTRSGGMPYIEANTDEGRMFLKDAGWARSYAKRNRQLILNEVEKVIDETLGVSPIRESLIDCDHNHTQREQHGGEMLWVHRKGASSVHVNATAIIPGSMGTPSFHVTGIYFDTNRIKSLLEEAPSAYKDVLKVMKCQKKLIRIKRKLNPILSYKG
jgi:tRNA-splicing ligase RtcB (3'-phosphate/5'-hydroxy nucleic acid ligase)